MTPRLLEPPKWFLNVKTCKDIYEAFKHQVDFREPLPPFDAQFPHQLEDFSEDLLEIE